MIGLLREESGKALLLEAIGRDPIIGLRLYGDFNVYGFSADFRIQEQGGVAVAALSASADGGCHLVAGGEADFEELSGFLLSCGFKSVFCSESVASRLQGFKIERSAPFMIYRGPSFGEQNPDISESTSLMEVYRLLKEVGGGFSKELPDAEVWYVYNSHMTRHKLGRVCGVYRAGEILSTASITAIGETHALIGSVATKGGFRGKGYATSLIRYLADIVIEMGKTPCLYCAEPALAGYYSSLGLSEAGNWVKIIHE